MLSSRTSACPSWLADRIRDAGGAVRFFTYMDWVLHDPLHGAYGGGGLRIGPEGDFVTSPSLGDDFSALLAPQLAEWLEALLEGRDGGRPDGADGPRLALVEAGPGDGVMALQLARALRQGWPRLAGFLELVLIEPNPGMEQRQRRLLADAPLPVRWAQFEDLAGSPVDGVVVAHEVLDALPVERIVLRAGRWCRQMVALEDGRLHLTDGQPLPEDERAPLEELGLLPIHNGRGDGWCTELHPSLTPWMAACGRCLARGPLLVIDYALEARRYYAPQRRDGTLMAYQSQRASGDPLLEPGRWDLTAHLCIEALLSAAQAGGWSFLGQRRQGEALLALGLAQRLHALQGPPARANDPESLASLLHRREALLRLVDPAGLGDFRWMAFERDSSPRVGPSPAPSPLPLFLRDPPGPSAAPPR